MSKHRDIIAALDVGTTKICLLVAERVENGDIRILSAGTQPSRGLRKGEVINVAQTVDSIEKTFSQVENICEVEISSVFAGITGSHIQSYNSRAVLPVANPAVGVTEKDMLNAIEAARSVALPRECEILHTIPQEFSVDDREGIADPEGMQGTRLEARVHLVTGRTAAIRDIANCINQAGLAVAEVVLQHLASSLAVVRKEEQQSGVVLVDIGGGTTDYVFLRDETVWHTGVLSVGGDHVTNDISLGMKLLLRQAEELKKKYGSALHDRVKDDAGLFLPEALVRSVDGLSRRKLCQIIELRLVELFRLIRRDLEKAGHFQSIGSGLVLTGGSALLKNIADLAERETGLPVRIGTPAGVSGLREVIDSPVYSTAVGLIKYGFRPERPRPAGDASPVKFIGGLKRWLGRYF
ncbi:MAG: cell division protein FtsA [PVC group bacterium]